MSQRPSRVELTALAADRHPFVVDASIGSPVDPPPAFVPHLLACQGEERAYPPAAGTPALVESATRWFHALRGVTLPDGAVAPTMGSKEAIGTLAWLLRERRPDRGVVLIPGRAYPTYAEGARAAGCEIVRVPDDGSGAPAFDAVAASVWDRTLVAWVNSPSNPTGAVYDPGPVVALAREHGAVLASDEAYGDFVWSGEAPSALRAGLEGTLALVSLSKRSNLAGLRLGLVAGDPMLVDEVVARRRALGLLASGPSQAVAAEALADEGHVAEQRSRYAGRLRRLARVIEAVADVPVRVPDGGIYLWVRAPDDDGAAFARWLATRLGIVVADGADYGDRAFVRIAATVKDRAIDALWERGGVR